MDPHTAAVVDCCTDAYTKMPGESLLVVDDSPTVLKVVEAALTRAGYRVDTASDAESGMALARARRPAVILMDSLIAPEPGASPSVPEAADARTGGLDMCGALAADADLSKTPVVLMTAKGEDLEARYARVPNVIDYITKPFSPDAVLAVVTHVIEKTGAGTPPPGGAADTPRAAGATGPPSAVAEALSRSGGPAGGVGAEDVLGRLREAVADRLERHRQDSGAWELPAIARGALDDETLLGMLAEAGFEATGGGAGAGGPDLAGQLGAVSMSEVLSLLAAQSQTGALRVRTDGARVELFFRKGLIDFAAAVGVAEEFLLGRFAVEAGDITPEALTAVLAERGRGPGKPGLFGRDLVARGLLTDEQLRGAMRRQTAELVYESLRWAKGSFQFRRLRDLPELAQEAALGIGVDTLLLEGFRRVDEWRLIERDVGSFDVVFMRDDDRIAELPRGTLTREEIAVLDALGGRSTVREVVRGLRMGSFDVSKILYRLLRTKLIRRRVQPTAT
jgi:CheY-like chemotaxis protein